MRINRLILVRLRQLIPLIKRIAARVREEKRDDGKLTDDEIALIISEFSDDIYMLILGVVRDVA